MTIEIKVPQLPESVSDAMLVAWHRKPGDQIMRGENLVDLETDKVVLEVPAPASGVLQDIRIKNGTTVTAGTVLAVLAEQDSAASLEDAASDRAAVAGVTPAATPAGAAAKTSPAVRRLLEEHDLDATMVQGSGKDGRISKADVMAFLKADDSTNVTPGDRTPSVPAETAVVVERNERRVPMTRLRARIAERLLAAQQSAAMLTTFNEVDLTEVMALRSRYKDAFEKEHGVRLGFMSFFAKASAEALKKFPVVNASVEGNDVVYHNYYDIGIAVSTDRGLMVPVLRDVDQMSFATFETELGAVAKRAQDGSISMEELTGGTFTITNGGVFGSMMSTPILNQPQSAILGMHTIQQRPMVINNEIVARPMMYLALTYDHRIIDGKDSVQFLVSIKQLLEDPSRLLLQI
ncbi:MAG: 2-oxoglutarate dehydrogenase complex dihydrolipoyllysine-residue succinyltransferase [Gammaproteobacteria bacterium]|nr:2-oxoglutarate dehydrogenase complex dihydrolipoyllysine-residue succinyltransferase [Gammaproteobacteria bacterium]MDH5303663.1 2-oxoglutarate dehydrogenase complex dihydrolipoyllysine-residue succinyltransferase [Gammaproteobacteria bacterium]MDH5323136.1 2-oxoglutarate dehydrogenase complex dihydrolipoyllysine-residue succinyltransferase [Gammaproteobacteria bacterium]